MCCARGCAPWLATRWHAAVGCLRCHVRQPPRPNQLAASHLDTLQLFNTPEFGRVVAILHELMGLVSGTLTPLAVPPPPGGGRMGRTGGSPACSLAAARGRQTLRGWAQLFQPGVPPTLARARRPPRRLAAAGSYAQSVSALLMTWAVVGWLLPTLLLLPFEASEGPEHNQAGASAGGWRRLAAACGRLEVIVEAWLRRLVPFTTRPPGQRHRGSAEEQAARGAGTHSALCWMVTLAALWQLCCSMAPLYGSGGDAPPH